MAEPSPQHPPTSRKWEAFIATGLLPLPEECAVTEVDGDGFSGAFLNITSARIQGNAPDGQGAWPTVNQDVTTALRGKKPIMEKTANGVLFRIYYGELAVPAAQNRHLLATMRVINLEKKLGIVSTVNRVF